MMQLAPLLALASALLVSPGRTFRNVKQRHKEHTRLNASSSLADCGSIGCRGYNSSLACQCNDRCREFRNCCPDYGDVCEGSSAPADPSRSAAAYWKNTNMGSISAVQSRLRSTARKLSYSGLWNFYKKAWVNLPGGCKNSVYDVYSEKCWTPGSDQCGGYRREGDCYNREHSWPKSWWGGAKNPAYSDVFHVMPSDGYVNAKRGNLAFGEVGRATYRSSEGHLVGSCSVGTCFEPTNRVKGALARAHMYMAVRYRNELDCCEKDAVSGADLKPWTMTLMLQWHNKFPPRAWEIEFNERAYKEQGNRNPFIDYPEAAGRMIR